MTQVLFTPSTLKNRVQVKADTDDNVVNVMFLNTTHHTVHEYNRAQIDAMQDNELAKKIIAWTTHNVHPEGN